MELIKKVEIKNYPRLGRIYFPEFGGYKVMSKRLAEIAGSHGFFYDKPNLRITPEEKAYLYLFEIKESLQKLFHFDKKKIHEIKFAKIENTVIYRRGNEFKYGIRLSNKLEAYVEKSIFDSLKEMFPNPIKRN